MKWPKIKRKKQIREAVIQILRLSDRDFKNLIVIKFNKIDDNFPENWILLKWIKWIFWTEK